MRLTKLELQGFKSFADFTAIGFDQGVTAIVGPNGCGKSNVSDAVRWVLGEQRARLLRGAKMEEVIFQGSTARRPVNVAEVSLHFENPDGRLPVAYREVVITRRLSRSGESDYLLNGTPCRLRDIGDLLRGTGLGTDAGVVIESTMIDALLSDRPDDRRELFEEAAGVGLYRDRRRATERRLEETTVDLRRLDDLIAEVTTQVRSLARQRKRAERHAELTARRFTVEIALAAREINNWAEELAHLESRVGELRAQLPDAEGRVEAAERSRDIAHGTRTAAEAQRAEVSRLVASQRDEVQHLRGEMAVAEERQRHAVLRRQRAEAEASQGHVQGARIAEHRDRTARERSDLEGALRTLEAELAERQRREEASRDAAAVARTAADAAEGAFRDAQDRARHVGLDRERANRELDEEVQRAGVLEQERVRLADALAAVRREHKRATAVLADVQSDATAAAGEFAAALQADRNARERDASARSELVRLDETLTSGLVRIQALQRLERERVGLAPAAVRLLEDREQFGEGAVLGPLSDFLPAAHASAALVEGYLGPVVHAVLVRDQKTVDIVRHWHRQTSPGPLLLLPLDARSDAPIVTDPTGALAVQVASASPARAWVHVLLSGVEVIEGGAAFVDGRGAVWLPGTEAGPGPVRRRAELISLQGELATVEHERDVAAMQATTAREDLEEAQRRVTLCSDASAAMQHRFRESAEHHATLERRAQRAERDLSDATQLAEHSSARCNALRERIVAHDAEVAALGAALVEREMEVSVARAGLASAEVALESARDQRTEGQVEHAQLRARLEVASDRERRLGDELRSASERLEALGSELSSLSREEVALSEQIGTWRMELSARTAALADGETRMTAAERAVIAGDEDLTRAEHALGEARRFATSLADELHRAEVRFTELSGRRASIRERLETEWRRPLGELLRTAESLNLGDAALRAEADTLREQLEHLGPVNTLAIEEHDETARRLDFLAAQRADLSDARSALQQAIREIDTTARDLFMTTFTRIRENFQQTFRTLFDGGECDLRLEQPETPLDCDIEIHASPRGKRSQRIYLLSGGERALVALALLFGIFLTKPSPFCLLDEVDAPLDDANVGRFVRLLTEFKQRTQFIVITHNPRTTTEAADAVYGVTMQEPGVSSLVSVRMKGASVDNGVTREAEEAIATA